MNDEPEEQQPRPVFGKSGVCLHCLVWEVINKNAPPSPHDPSAPFLDARAIIGSLTEVVAELIAGIDDRNDRRRWINLTEEYLRDHVRKKRESGDHPKAMKARLQ